MIDIDKYEGHTPAPWTVDVHKVGEEISAIVIEAPLTTHTNEVLAEVEVENKYAETDAQLIADAPLLLEAYKRLRELLESVIENATEPSGDDGTDYRYCEVDAELVEMIEEEMNRLVIE